jgi:hypothetical protein
MSEIKYIVPQGMLDAARKELSDVGFRKDVICYDAERMLEAALRWLSENPIVPNDEQAQCLWISQILEGNTYSDQELARFCVVDWQRCMFLAPPEPDQLEEIEDLLWRNKVITPSDETIEENDRRIVEAFRRGQKAGSR